MNDLLENMKISKIYTDKEILESMQNFLETEGYIQLNNFFENDMSKFKKFIIKANYKSIYKPLEEKYSYLDLNECFDPDIIKFIEYFRSEEFLNFLEILFNSELNIKNLNLYKYSQKDFSILNDLKKRDESIDIYFDLSDIVEEDSWNEKMGGYLTYTTKEEEVFYLNPSFNCLTIVFKDRELMKYLKYINNKFNSKNCSEKGGNSIYRIEVNLEFNSGEF